MGIVATRQPFKALYIAQRLLTTFLLTPYWALKMIHINEATGIMLECTDKTREVDDRTLKETSFVWFDPVDERLVRGIAKSENTRLVKIPGYVWPKLAKVEEAEGYVGYWIHGGAYRMGNGSETFGPSLIPRYISQNSRIKTVVSHLIMMLMRYLYDEKIHPLPAAIMLFSPWLDMAYETVHGHSEHPNSYCDVLCTSRWYSLQFIPESAPASLLASPYLSSNRAPAESFVGYPRIFISLGGAEVFVEEATELADKMREAGVDVTLDIQPDAVHDFWGFPNIVPNEKGRVELKKHLSSWIDNLSPL